MLVDGLEAASSTANAAGPESYALLIVIGIVLFTILLFIFSHLARYVSFLKIKERIYIDDKTLDSVFTTTRLLGIIYVSIAILFIGAKLEIEMFVKALEFITDYLFILMAGVTFFSFMLAAKLSSVWFSIKGEKAKKDPSAMVKSGILDFGQRLIKYILLFFGLLISFFVALLTTPNQGVRDQIFNVLGISNLDTTVLLQEIISLITILVVLYLVAKLISMMLDDFKTKSKKFPGKLIDLTKSFVRYLLYWLAFVVTLMVILDILGFPYLELVIFIVVAITLSIIIIIGISPSTKNAIAGIVLLLTDSINKGDWVKLGDETVGEVIEQHLIFTRVRTNFGDVMDIPNEKVLGSTIHNFTTIDGLRLDIDIPINSEVSSEEFEKTIIECCEGVEGLDPKYDIEIRLLSISKGTAIYCINIWVLDPPKGDNIRSILLKKFHDRLKQKGINLGSMN